MTRLLASVVVLLCVQHLAAAEMNGYAVTDGSQPLSELSTTVTGKPVHDPGRSVRDGSAARLSDGSVRGSANLDMSSGSVTEFSAGSVTQRYALTPNAAAVNNAIAASIANQPAAGPQGETIAQPQTELAPLQEHLRDVQPLPRDATDSAESEEPPLAAEAVEDTQPDTDAAATEPQPEPIQPTAESAADQEPDAAALAATDGKTDSGEADPGSTPESASRVDPQP